MMQQQKPVLLSEDSGSYDVLCLWSGIMPGLQQQQVLIGACVPISLLRVPSTGIHLIMLAFATKPVRHYV